MGTFVIMSPSPNIGGTCPACPIWIDAPEDRTLKTASVWQITIRRNTVMWYQETTQQQQPLTDYDRCSTLRASVRLHSVWLQIFLIVYKVLSLERQLPENITVDSYGKANRQTAHPAKIRCFAMAEQKRKLCIRTGMDIRTRHSVTTVWNSLPESVRASPSLQVFRSRLKTELFARSCSCSD